MNFLHHIRNIVIAIAFGAASISAQAAAPMAKTPTPGFFRFMLGDFEVTALNDGTTRMPWGDLLSDKEKAKADLAKAHLTSPVESSFNGFLVNTGSKLVLIDTGAGTMFAPTLGKLLTNLKASGYQPEQVDEVYITHFHGDHVGGLVTPDGKAAFPNATVRAGQGESDYWLSDANAAAAPDQQKGGFKNAKIAIGAYASAGKYKPIEGAAELVPGISARPTKGHTPGHTAYLVESKGQKMVVLGDMIHSGEVQFPDPAVGVAFDWDGKLAIAEREKLFAEAAKDGFLLAGPHLPFPAIGHIAANGSGYLWQPVNFSQFN